MIYFESQLDLDGKVEHKRSFVLFRERSDFGWFAWATFPIFVPPPPTLMYPSARLPLLLLEEEKSKLKKSETLFTFYFRGTTCSIRKGLSHSDFFWAAWSTRSDSFGRVSKPREIYVQKWIMCLECGRICVWMNVGKQMASKPVFQWKQTFSVNIQLD